MAYELNSTKHARSIAIYQKLSKYHLEYKTISEGSFRFDELKGHRDQYNAPSFVSIAEDTTRIVGQIEYDSETD